MKPGTCDQGCSLHQAADWMVGWADPGYRPVGGCDRCEIPVGPDTGPVRDKSLSSVRQESGVRDFGVGQGQESASAEQRGNDSIERSGVLSGDDAEVGPRQACC